jgi:hypothetical protein
MLAAPQLPSSVRSKILEYIQEKTAGLYGDHEAKIIAHQAHYLFVREYV